MDIDDINNEESQNETLEIQDNEAQTPTAEEADIVAQEERDIEQMAEHSQIHGMYKTWFLDYASYVILDRAVPNIEDGLKPVQRRVLHVMDKIDDGRYNKVANIVGETMKYHPHGDASIYAALVQLGQKNMLIDTQGNWGNILTGDEAAAARYIEGRLTKFAQDVAFNKKTTIWQLTYDGRNEEPVTLPMKFPLLLAQGVEGIAVGLASKILPHNFNELIDASIAILKNESFEIFPDFPTGGQIDVAKYNDGMRGGSVRIRAKINKVDSKTLSITEIPYTCTTGSLIESIKSANDKGKIKIKSIDDITSANVEIVLSLHTGVSPDKTIDALYAFTDCEISISPNACVIDNKTPRFMSVSDILRHSTDRTMRLLQQELEIRYNELMNEILTLSLEKLFIEQRIYKDAEFEKAKSNDEAITHIDKRLSPFYKDFIREVTNDDLLHLLEIKMARILRFNSDAAEEKLCQFRSEMEDVKRNIEGIVDYTIEYFKSIKKKYGKEYPRLTEIRSFDNIEMTKVAIQNQKLYFNREDGFMGYASAKVKGEYIQDCSDIDDVIVFYNDGRYVIKNIGEKVNIGMNVLYIAIFKKNDTRTIYNTVYVDGETGVSYVKRFAVTGITHDKEYDLTMGTPKSKVVYFSANPNGEAEVLKVLLKPKLKLRNVVFEYDMAQMAVKGRASRGNVLTKNDLLKIVLKRRGVSTLGGRKVYFERETLRLNPDGRGELLGEFAADDLILHVTTAGEVNTTDYGFEQHFEDNILRIEKYDPRRTWTAIYYDGETKQNYIKRFRIEPSSKPILIISETPKSKLLLLSNEDHPRIEITYGGADKWRQKEEIDAYEYISEKGIKAKGKRIGQWEVKSFTELEPLIPTILEEAPESEEEKNNETEAEDIQPTLF
ncbi:MAG: DNA gyrase/topoisomerase IV subunit A [Marinilabiliaceae bacterium]|nr:DNA gyrase/topoisomerase IV subunit A [Marinilabiliaceae bacterium]